MSIQHKLLLSLLLVLILSTTGFSQTPKSNEESAVIPEQVMEHIVRKVLIHYFKPTTRIKAVLLSRDGIKQSWLPKIKGIDFQLVDTQQERHRLTNHYKFENPFGDQNSIGFGYGSGGSGYSGDTWKFRTSKQSVKIWKDRNGWGSSGDDFGDGTDSVPSPQLMRKKT